MPHDEKTEAYLARSLWFTEFQDQPLSQYIAGCYSHHWAMQKEQPKSDLFWFVWMVKGHQEMTSYLEQANDALKIVEGELARWTNKRSRRGRRTQFGNGKSGDHWQEWFDMVADDARAEFFDT